MILELLASFADRTFEEVKENDPEQYDTVIKSFITLIEGTTKLLNHSPELRKAFADIHIEFMQHPEVADTIAAAKAAIARSAQAEE